MKLARTQICIYKNRETGKLFTNMFDGKMREPLNTEEKFVLTAAHMITKKRSMTEDEKYRMFEIHIVSNPSVIWGKQFFNNSESDQNITENNSPEKPNDNIREILIRTIDKLMNFFSEFSFEPNFRFINTLQRACFKTSKLAQQYISNYFELTDNPYQTSIIEKMKSEEFRQIISELHDVTPTKQINQRFRLYYGSQGTGKTTEAIQEANGNCMVCHSAMLPSDLMEDFKFNDGKAEFTPSALQNAMTNGEKIVLDEINLLPFESLRFLQSILDGKKEFIYKGKTIEIKDGFEIIGTMNLNVNGTTYALPEPLVDRCSEIKKFKLTADKLVDAII